MTLTIILFVSKGNGSRESIVIITNRNEYPNPKQWFKEKSICTMHVNVAVVVWTQGYQKAILDRFC